MFQIIRMYIVPSRWQCVLRRRSTETWLLELLVRIPLTARYDCSSVVSVVCCVVSGLCDGLITCWVVQRGVGLFVCDLESWRNIFSYGRCFWNSHKTLVAACALLLLLMTRHFTTRQPIIFTWSQFIIQLHKHTVWTAAVYDVPSNVMILNSD